MVKVLIENGADINIINKDEDSALIIASNKGEKKESQVLIYQVH